MAGEQVDFESKWGELVAQAWSDAALKKRLLADPAAVLKEHGLIVPAGITVKVVENTDKVIHLTLPKPPSPAELSEAELQRVAGGERCGGCRHERCSFERCSFERCSFERCSFERCSHERCSHERCGH